MMLDRFVSTAKAAWPEWAGADEAAFARFAGALRAEDGGPVALENLRAGDLWLAFHAAWGHPEAQRTLEATCFRDLASHLRARRASPSQAEEAVQRLRHRLLVADERQGPRLLTYGGRGDLRAWVRVAALRTWLNLERETSRERGSSDDELARHATSDLELEFLKGTYRDSFHRAFLEVLSELPASERLVLKLHYLDRIGMEEIGRLLGVHRLTVLRRLERTRQLLAETTKERLASQLRLSGTEVESLLRLIQSRFDMSLRSAFEASPEGNARTDDGR